MDRIEDSFDTASGQEGRLRPAALNTITELPRVVKNDQATRLDLAALRKREDPVPDRFEQLKRKYQSVLGTLQKEGAQLQNLNMDGNQLYLKATAPPEASKNRIWDASKLVDTNFADLKDDIEFLQMDQTYTVQADDNLSQINKYKKIMDANKLDDPDQIKVGQPRSRVGEDMFFRRPQAKNRPIQSAILCVILCILFLCVSMLAQVTSGTISGRVQDTTGAVINNATVTISNPSNGFNREIKTSGIGQFVAPNLLPGTYNVTVEAPGFKKLETQGFTLSAASKLDTGTLVLSVGATANEVTVTADAGQVQIQADFGRALRSDHQQATERCRHQWPQCAGLHEVYPWRFGTIKHFSE